ncbi:MAG: four helix bundle protein [Bacteroidetes bacterium]|nr:four helix bundle protein [Bacteroidota bacterium]
MTSNNKQWRIELRGRIDHYILKVLSILEKVQKDNIARQLGDRLIESSLNIAMNYAQSENSRSRTEFTDCFRLTLRNCNQSKIWLSLLKESKKIKIKDIEWYFEELTDFCKIFTSSILKLEAQRINTSAKT